MCGAGEGGLGQTILGVVLVIVGTYVPGAQALVPIGWGMIVGGVAQLIAPNTSMAESGPPDRPDSKPSSAFDGAVNTAAQGNPVPACYGRMIVGSQVISAGMTVEQL
jgi:predicted phage tail protein